MNTVDESVDAAIGLGWDVVDSLQRIAASMDKAHEWGRIDLWSFIPFVDAVAKFIHIRRANIEVERCTEHFNRFRHALVSLDAQFPNLDVGLAPGVVRLDVLEQFPVYYRATDELERARRSANIGISRIQVIVKRVKATR